jgi:hypothetical protein
MVFSFQLSNNTVIASEFDAIKVDHGDAFLYGNFIEVGISSDGAFGSEVVSPKGLTQGKTLGYISDPLKTNNFTEGYHGDFFLPQIPEEGWGIYLNGISYNNNRNSQKTNISGSFEGVDKTTTTAKAIWKGKVNGLEITQIYRIYKTGLAIIMDISLKNTTTSLMQDVYYMRTVDPDNNAAQNPSGNDDKYITENIIRRQGDAHGGAAVIAKQNAIPLASNQITKTHPSVLGLCGHGANSRVAHGGTDNPNFPYYRNPKDVYDSAQVVGDSKTEDAPIAIAFKFDNIFPGQTIKFRAGYQLADITVSTIDLDADDSSSALGNNFTQVYKLNDTATIIADTDVTVEPLADDELIVATSIKISDAHPDDKLVIIGALPDGITLDTEEDNSDTEIHLIGDMNKASYIRALQQITFVNNNTSANTETRHISVIVLDTNYTASTAAVSIIEIITPVTLTDDTVTEDNIVNATEANNLTLSGTAAPNLSIDIVFTDKNGQKVIKTVTSNADGIWVLTTDPADISMLADGDMTVTITSTDANNNQSSYSKNFQKDTIVLLDITSPKDGETASSTSPVITGKSDPDATVTITLADNTSYTTTADSLGDWSITLPKQTLGSSLTLSITAEDTVGNTTKSNETKKITITIPSIPLEVTGVDSSTTPTVTGTSAPNTIITVTVPTTHGTETCTTTADADGNWSCQLPVLTSGGPYTAVITTTDSKGNSSSITHDITVPKLPLEIDSPTDGANLSDSSPFVSGTSNPNSVITITASTGEKCVAITDKNGKWQCELPTLPLDQTITLTVVATDNANNATTKTLSITTPKLALKITGIDISTTPTFTGTSSPDAKITVTLPISDTKSETCITTTKADGSWSCTLPLLPSGGPYTATVTAEDNEGNYSTDTQVLATPNIPLSIDSHADNAIITDTSPTIAGTSTAGTTITLTASTGQTCTTTTDSNGQWSCKILLLPLNQTLTLSVETTDAIGNKTTKTTTLTTPNLPISITTVTASTTPTITGTSTAGTTISVDVSNGSITKTCTAITDANGNWSCQLSTLPTGGAYTATVSAEDSKGNTASITQTFSVPNLPLIIDSPANNAVISGTTPTVSGTSQPNTSITVTLSTGQSCSTTTDSDNHWSCQLPSLTLNTNYTITVTTTDSVANETTLSIDISTDTLPLAIINPGDKGTSGDTTPSFIGTTTPGTTVTVTAETGQECQAIADKNGDWVCELPEMPVGGPYKIIITAEDNNGNTTSITETILIPKTPLTIISPTQGETIVDNHITVTGTSDANTTITVLGSDGESCTTTSDEAGRWSCQLENLQSGDNKYITVISGNEGDPQKVALVKINIKNSGEKVTTILEGGGGAISAFMLFLLGLTMLLKRVILRNILSSK